MSVAHTNVPILVEPSLTFAAVRNEMLERDRERAARDVDEPAKVIRASASELNVTSRALEGVPKDSS